MPVGSSMRLSKQTFENQDIALDHTTFDQCIFKKCRLVIFGNGGFALSNCRFEGSEFTFDGPAALTIKLLTEMRKGGFEGLVDPILESIRSGNGLPSPPPR